MKKILVACLTLLVVMSGLLLAQDTVRVKPAYLHSGKIGLGLDGITGSPNLLLKYFFNNQLAMQVIVGLDLDVPGGSAPANFVKVTGVTVRGGLSLLFHISQEQVSPYVGIEGVFQYTKQGGILPVAYDPKNSVVGNAVLGAEYFLNEMFTIGIRQAIGANIQLKRDLPKEETSIKLNTSTLVTGRFYFN
ncbi:MAG: hypothetical protein AAB393_19245 [Bacteroidota bacterium]